MKHSSFTFVETFPVIALVIDHLCRDRQEFASRNEISRGLLDDPSGRELVKAAQRKRDRKKSLQLIAGNMVDFFSQRWTMEDPTWDGLFGKFRRERSGGRWCYKPHIGVKPVEIIREGAMVQVFVNTYERDPVARAKCIEKYGTDCYVCGFSFRAVYGEMADGIIHVHHLQPHGEVGGEHEVNPIKDLRPVCPNCHAVLHWRIPAYSIKEVQDLLRRRKSEAEPRSVRLKRPIRRIENF